MRKNLCYFLLVTIVIMLNGCSGSIKNMQIAEVNETSFKPQEGMSKVVFMRPSSLGYAVQSSVFEIKDNKPEIVGIVAAKKKIVKDFTPGKYLFIVVGESADFMYADLDVNKTYYVLVTPRMGMWKARFSLKPVTSKELLTNDFTEWDNDCQLVESNESTRIWAIGNTNSINEKYTEYYQDWLEKDEKDRPILLKTDFK